MYREFTDDDQTLINTIAKSLREKPEEFVIEGIDVALDENEEPAMRIAIGRVSPNQNVTVYPTFSLRATTEANLALLEETVSDIRNVIADSWLMSKRRCGREE